MSEWSKTPPSEEGWYWARVPGCGKEIVHIYEMLRDCSDGVERGLVHVCGDEDSYFTVSTGNGFDNYDNNAEWWTTPIEVPE